MKSFFCLLSVLGINAILISDVFGGDVCSTPSTRFEYRGLTAESVFIDEDGFAIDLARGVHWRGHSGLGLYVCLEKEPLYCFHSSAMSFAVPRSAPKVGDAWTSRNKRFRVTDEGEFDLLGVRSKVMAIASDDAPLVFYYSMDRGLLAISRRSSSEGAPDLFISTKGYGFPSSCPKMKKGGRR